MEIRREGYRKKSSNSSKAIQRLQWHQLHNIKKLIVINHRDCGAAKIINGKKEFSSINETKVHKNSFQTIKTIFKKKYPKLKIE